MIEKQLFGEKRTGINFDKYDDKSATHRQIKKDIEEGDGLPDIARTHEVDEALEQAGFEVQTSRDVAGDSDPGRHHRPDPGC